MASANNAMSNSSDTNDNGISWTRQQQQGVGSLEQSIRKFRIFEALRKGDTMFLSKALGSSSEKAGKVGVVFPESLRDTNCLEDTTILHLAVQCAEHTVVEYVLKEGARAIDVNARDCEGNTALHVAAAQGRGPIVRLLLEQRGINDCIRNFQSRLPMDMSRTSDITQQLQLSRSFFVDSKIREIQTLIATRKYDVLAAVLEEEKVKILLDINGGEFVTDITTSQTGGTLLHEAARRKDGHLIQELLLHGADPFRRDRSGRLPQDVTKDEPTRSILRKSPAVIVAQRGIQERAILGTTHIQGGMKSKLHETLVGKGSREMNGYLKKWTNYRRGYQLRWFVLEDGVLSYYKHQDDAGSACRGAVNMRIAKLNMDPTEKRQFEIIGKSSVKYSLKANHEVEAKRWFWALNNAIQWSKDQAKQEDRQREKGGDVKRQGKFEYGQGWGTAKADLGSGSTLVTRRYSQQSHHVTNSSSISKTSTHKVSFASASEAGSVPDEEGTAFGMCNTSITGDNDPTTGKEHGTNSGVHEDDEDYGDVDSIEEVPCSRDAFDITAQSASLQLDMMSQVHTALQAEQQRNPSLHISDAMVLQAVAIYDGTVKSLKGILADLVKMSRDRDAYWQYKFDREADMRRLWEDSMAQIAREQEVLEARVGESEEKRKRAKKALRNVLVNTNDLSTGHVERDKEGETAQRFPHTADDMAIDSRSSNTRRNSVIERLEALSVSESDSEVDDEFFDAIDAEALQILQRPSVVVEDDGGRANCVTEPNPKAPADLRSSFHGYEDGVRSRLDMEADDRPKVSLWSILKSMIGKDMTKMTLPVSFNEPTSLLQRCAEDMEYSELLDVAAQKRDSAERLVYVSAFAVSEYASTIGRVAKPFNPLLGETYEYARPDKNYRFFIEQVSHHPPIGAAWAESPHWTYYGESAVKSKFYGKSFDINPLGTWFLKLRLPRDGREELYTWKKVTSSVIGIITGSPTVDNYGMMEIKNWITGEVSTIDFKPRGWTAGSAYQISGHVKDAQGKPRFSIGGRWNSKIYARLTPGDEEAPSETRSPPAHKGSISNPNQLFVVWEANPRPADIPFNLTPFGVSLNAISDKLRPFLPPTDTRLRPDQRAMEDGRYDFAATEKNRLEEKQRKRRRQREADGQEFCPAWYSRAICETTGEEYWKSNGRYWKQRDLVSTGKNGKWSGIEDIF